MYTKLEPFTLAELDPEADLDNIPDMARWQQLARQAARDEDAPSLEPNWADYHNTDYETGRRNARAIPPYGRLTMDRYLTPEHPDVLQIDELADLYAAMQPTASADLVTRLHEMTRFLLLDLLIHTGRPLDWLATLRLGRCPAPDELLDQPVYDVDHGAICYTPDCTIGIPPCLMGHDEVARAARAAQAAAYEPVRLWHNLPLTPRQVSFLSVYLRLRTRALQARSLVTGQSVVANHDHLFLLPAQPDGLRLWTAADALLLCQDLTAALSRLHPGWRAIQPTHFRVTFNAWYRYYGLDPIYALAISGHYRNELQLPTIYSRVRVEALARVYAAAQEKLRTAIEVEYRRLIGNLDSHLRDLVLWRRKAPPRAKPWTSIDSFGSWHCPYSDHVRALFAGLAQMAAVTDPAVAQRGRVAHLAAGLTALAGLRPAEVCNLRDRGVDLECDYLVECGHLVVMGRNRDNFAGADRVVPIPAALRSALTEAIANSLAIANDLRSASRYGRYLLWLPERGVPAPLREDQINEILREAGQSAGLDATQVPDWYSLRHYWRSRALDKGLPFETINALMGHQIRGCELYNPAVNLDPKLILAQGQDLADQIARELE